MWLCVSKSEENMNPQAEDAREHEIWSWHSLLVKSDSQLERWNAHVWHRLPGYLSYKAWVTLTQIYAYSQISAKSAQRITCWTLTQQSCHTAIMSHSNHVTAIDQLLPDSKFSCDRIFLCIHSTAGYITPSPPSLLTPSLLTPSLPTLPPQWHNVITKQWSIKPGMIGPQ